MSPAVVAAAGVLALVAALGLFLLWRCLGALRRIEAAVRRSSQSARSTAPDPESVLNARLVDVQTRRFAPRGHA